MADLFYKEDRNIDFLNACLLVSQEEPSLSVSEIASKAILTPARSFYIHPREYANIIRKGRNGLPRSKAKREQYLEIIKRYEVLQSEQPTLEIEVIARILAEQSAPRFYISASRATSLYYELLRK